MKILVLLAVLALSACTNLPTTPDTPEPKKVIACDDDSAYEAGMNDGMSRNKMNSDFLSVCSKEKQTSLRKSYKSGYIKGVDTKVAEKSRPADDTYSQPGGVNIQIGTHSSKSWFCEVKAFTSTYKSFGSTEQDGSYKAQKLCEKEHHSMHCDDVKCVVNQ